MTEPGGGWAVIKSTMQFVNLLRQDAPGPGSASSLTTCRFQLIRLCCMCPREEPNFFRYVVLPVQRCSGHVTSELS